jgi:Flp pilus assembly protein TadG
VRPKSERWGLRRARDGGVSQERGAALVEFAVVMPFLLLMILGIIEFGYFLGEFNDVRHGAREGARVAAVNAGANSILDSETCDSMDLTSNVTVEFTDGATGAIGDTGILTVSASPDSLSGLGLIEIFLPNTIESTVEFRLEQPSDDWSTHGPSACP